MINCGIIGFGKMGKIRAKAIEESGRGQVALIYDIAVQPDSPYTVAESADAFICAPEVDAVFICTPNNLIPELCTKGIEAGKHIFA